jgi:hypothetical protein
MLGTAAAHAQTPAPKSDLVSPQPVAPLSGSNFDHFPRTTDLKWKPVPGAISYSIEIDCFHCCEIGKWCSQIDKPRISTSGIKTTSYTFQWVGANLGRWRVWAVAANGKEGSKSDWQDFLYLR